MKQLGIECDQQAIAFHGDLQLANSRIGERNIYREIRIHQCNQAIVCNNHRADKRLLLPGEIFSRRAKVSISHRPRDALVGDDDAFDVKRVVEQLRNLAETEQAIEE